MTPAQRFNMHHQRRLESGCIENKKISGLITDGTETEGKKPDNVLIPYDPAASNASEAENPNNPADQFGQRKSP